MYSIKIKVLSLTNLFRFILIFSSAVSFAQYGPGTGPGGVGSSATNGLWLKADSFTAAVAVSSWADSSGNGNNAGQGTTSKEPASLLTSTLNGMPVVRFDGTDEMVVPDANILDGTAGISYFAAISPTNLSGAPRGILSKRLDRFANPEYAYAWFFHSGNNLNLDIVTSNNRVKSAAGLFSNGSNYILSFTFDGTLVAAQRSKMYNEMNLIKTGSENSSVLPNSPQPLTIGILNVGYNNNLNGDYAEIIHYNYTVNEAERIIVNNYLSAKYSIPLTSKDYYLADTSGGNFDHDVAGIGQAADGSNHLDSKGSGIIRMNTPSSLGNDRFLFWGEETKDPTYNFTAISSSYSKRLNSKWRVSKRNNLGTVTVVIDNNTANLDLTGKMACANLKLVVANNSTFSSPTSYRFTESAGVFTATGVSFTDGDYFTLEYFDEIVLDDTKFYNGSGTANVPNTLDDCYKLLVKTTATGALPLTESAKVKEIEIEAGGILAVNTGAGLEVTNGIFNNGEIRLVGTSQLVRKGGTTSQITGSGLLYKDQIAVSTNAFQSGYWSSPVRTSGAMYTINDVLKDGSVATTAVATAGAAADITFTGGILDGITSPITIASRWMAKLTNATDWTRGIDPLTTTFSPTEGWNMKSMGATFTFKGIPNDGDYTSTIDKDRLSLVGNPYPSAIDADQFIADNTGAINGVLYFYNSSTDSSHRIPDYTGTYYTRVAGVGTPVGTTAISGADYFIPVGQAFFVTRDAVGSGAITFKNSQRAFKNIGGESQFFGKSEAKTSSKKESPLAYLRLGLSFDVNETRNFKRELVVAFRGLTDNYEMGYDAEMFDRQPSDLALKVSDREVPFVITGVDYLNDTMAIPLELYLDAEREVTFSLDALEKVNATVYLRDAVTGTDYNLSESTLSLTLPTGNYTNRFSIAFANSSVLGSEDNLLVEDLKVLYRKEVEEIVIQRKNDLEIYGSEVTTILGQRIASATYTNRASQEYSINTATFSSAFYILKVKTNKGTFIKKILF